MFDKTRPVYKQLRPGAHIIDTMGFDKKSVAKMREKSNVNVAVSYANLAARGWSARKAALQVGVCPSHLSRVLNGVRQPSKVLLKRLAKLPQLPPVKVHKAAKALVLQKGGVC